MSGEPPTKKARVSVEDSEMLPITEGTQDFEEFAEWSDNVELHGLQGKRLNVEMEDINMQIALQASLAKEKIEEKTKEIEPAQLATALFFSAKGILTREEDVKRGVKRNGNWTVGVEPETTVELEKVLKQVHKASSGSEDNMSLMMTGP